MKRRKPYLGIGVAVVLILIQYMMTARSSVGTTVTMRNSLQDSTREFYRSFEAAIAKHWKTGVLTGPGATSSLLTTR